MSAINSYTALESLCLDQCTLLTTLHLLLPRLQRASFRGCPALAAVRPLRCCGPGSSIQDGSALQL